MTLSLTDQLFTYIELYDYGSTDEPDYELNCEKISMSELYDFFEKERNKKIIKNLKKEIAELHSQVDQQYIELNYCNEQVFKLMEMTAICLGTSITDVSIELEKE
jgi:3-keto-L-gulonate-6-phosphate decarboxylase